MSSHSENFWRDLMLVRMQANRANIEATRALQTVHDRQSEVDSVCAAVDELLPTVPAKVGAVISKEMRK